MANVYNQAFPDQIVNLSSSARAILYHFDEV